MRRLSLLDKSLLAVFTVAWLICFGLSVEAAINQLGYPSLIVVAPSDPDGYPALLELVPNFDTSGSGLQVGDRLHSVGGTDLRGRGHVALYAPFAQKRGGDQIAVVYERSGELRSTSLVVGSYRIYWPRLPAAVAIALTAMLLLLRAGSVPVVRTFALAQMCLAFILSMTFGRTEFEIFVANALHVGALALAAPLGLRAALLFPDGVSPASRWVRSTPWVFLLMGPFEASRFYEVPFSRELGAAGMNALSLVYLPLLLGILTLGYRRANALGRRQLRWLLYGFYVAFLFPATALVLAATDVRFMPLLGLSMAGLVLVPVCLIISITRYDLFDIDRLISSTVSYTGLGIVLLAGLLAAVPRAAQAVSGSIGVETGTAELVLSALLAAIVVPSHRWLRPRIDRVFFAEQHALEEGIHQLLSELSRCAGARELVQLAGERFLELLRPQSCVIYARVPDVFQPVFVHGSAVPPVFEARSTLVTALEGRSAPLTAEHIAGGRRAARLSAFDRAALATLGVPVVVPIRRADDLVAFACLGPRRSGDVYTSTELALLSAVADRISGTLLRFDQEQMIREARAMQERLRRYVPGALAEELAQGRDLEAGEREVSVLFVDIRGYASYAEERRPEEIFATVNRYTEAVTGLVRKHGGSVVEFNGDGMMAVFGAPRALADKESAATRAGCEIVTTVRSLAAGPQSIDVGVGIATGPAYVGNVRGADRLIWTAIGDTTNLAARLQEMTRELDASLIIDRATGLRAGDLAGELKQYPAVRIRGRQRPEELLVLPLAASGRLRAG